MSRNKPQSGTGHVGQTQTGLQSLLRLNGPNVRALFLKHREHHLNFEICTESAAKALLESMKHSCKSHVKYSLGFSLRNHPEVCECARQHDWYIISVSGLWSWTLQSHDQIKRNDSIFFFFFCI